MRERKDSKGKSKRKRWDMLIKSKGREIYQKTVTLSSDTRGGGKTYLFNKNVLISVKTKIFSWISNCIQIKTNVTLLASLLFELN